MEVASESAQNPGQQTFPRPFASTGAALNKAPPNARLMLVDGTSVLYRAYYKLLGIFVFPYNGLGTPKKFK